MRCTRIHMALRIIRLTIAVSICISLVGCFLPQGQNADDGTLPAVPTGLSVGSATISSLHISWDASERAANYQLFRDTSPDGTYAALVYSGSNRWFNNINLLSGTTYYYKIRASNDSGVSQLSSHACGTTGSPSPPPVPTGLSAGSPSQTTLLISWNSSQGANFYTVRRDTSDSGPFSSVVYSGVLTHFTNLNLVSDSTYYYRVAAGNSYGTSDLSASVLGRTLPTSYSGNNNWNALSCIGFSIGKGTASNALLSKPISAIVRNDQKFFMIGTAYATRISPYTEWTYLIVPITNITSGNAFSFVKMMNIELKNNQQTVLTTPSATFVTGSVGALSTAQTNTCLAPLETGYFLQLVLEDIYSNLDVVEFDLMYDTWVVNNPDSKIVPTEITYTPGTSFDVLKVKLWNYGTATGIVGSFSKYIMFYGVDALGWGFASDNINPFSGEIAPAGHGSVEEDGLLFYGSATTIISFIDFEDKNLSATALTLRPKGLKAFNNRQEYERSLIDRRNEVEETKRKNLLESR